MSKMGVENRPPFGFLEVNIPVATKVDDASVTKLLEVSRSVPLVLHHVLITIK